MILPWRNVSLAGGPDILSSVTDAETAKLQELATDAGEVLEVGSAYGYSAIAMALAGAHVTAVDPHAGENPGSLGMMRANLDAYGVADRVTVIAEPSQQALPKLEAGTFGLVFIDADHREPAVTHDVTWALKLLRPGGTLACHDLDEGSCPGVRAALDKLFDHPEPTVDTLFTIQV
jgi:predicted O-methyltransferase YrrM